MTVESDVLVNIACQIDSKFERSYTLEDYTIDYVYRVKL